MKYQYFLYYNTLYYLQIEGNSLMGIDEKTGMLRTIKDFSYGSIKFLHDHEIVAMKLKGEI